MMAFYKARFRQRGRLHVLHGGAFNIDATLPQLARWVGGLPSTGTRSSQFQDIGVRFPTGTQKVEVQKGREPRAQTLVSFFADPSFDPNEQERVITATAVFRDRYATRCAKTRQTYTVSVGLSRSSRRSMVTATWPVQFGAAPDNIAGMTDRVLKVQKMQTEGPSADLVAKARKAPSATMKPRPLQKRRTWHASSADRASLLGGNPPDDPDARAAHRCQRQRAGAGRLPTPRVR